MTDLPATFRAFVVDKPAGGAFTRGLRDRTPSDLPDGEVTVRVAWSSVNFKDGLAGREDGKVLRGLPRVPGHRSGGLGHRVRRARRPGRLRGAGQRVRPGHREGWRVQRGPARAGRLGGPVAGWPQRARGDGHRDRRVHRGDGRGRAGAARSPAGRRAGPGDRRLRRSGHDRRRPAHEAGSRGLGGRPARTTSGSGWPGWVPSAS